MADCILHVSVRISGMPRFESSYARAEHVIVPVQNYLQPEVQTFARYSPQTPSSKQ